MTLLIIPSLSASFLQRLTLALVPLGCLILLQFALTRWSAHEVREGPEYDVLFIAGGVAWLGFAGAIAHFLGISARDDAIEARNPAAVAAVCGAMTGASLCYRRMRISEANSDVPGGYTEASSFTRAMAAHYPRTQIAGDPAAELVDAIRAHVRPDGCAALLCAPGYMEDRQVV